MIASKNRRVKWKIENYFHHAIHKHGVAATCWLPLLIIKKIIIIYIYEARKCPKNNGFLFAMVEEIFPMGVKNLP